MDVLGIDIGGTTVKGARVDALGSVLATGSCATPSRIRSAASERTVPATSCRGVGTTLRRVMVPSAANRAPLMLVPPTSMPTTPISPSPRPRSGRT